jgi:hypothetical protein
LLLVLLLLAAGVVRAFFTFFLAPRMADGFALK